ncbi:MAG: ABC transporter permease [Deltaproteobacteria bacterium]|nr:ABC transporter permease [Deltaproteobacteria bacterium]
MIDSFYLASHYLLFHRIRSLTVVACLVLVAALPVALGRILDETEEQLMARAATTPLLLGAKGSSLDLVMSAVYFGGQTPDPISLAEVERIEETDLAYAIPVHTGFSARGAPIVGTTIDYFEFRELRIVAGRSFAVLGESVLGAGVARRLGLGPGDALVSSPESFFDLAGAYPLKTKVVGVLAPSGTPDDLAVFVDLKTTWVMQGIGHGHQDLSAVQDPTLVMKREEGRVVGSAKVVEYQEVTEANRDSFHFHGEPASYPLGAALIVPHDERAGTLLLGRFVDGSLDGQLVRPRAIVGDLMETIFRIKDLLDLAVVIVGTAAIAALVLVFMLAFRLRAPELRTNFEIGASRGTTARLLAAELVLLGGASVVGVALLLVVVDRFSPLIVRSLFVT